MDSTAEKELPATVVVSTMNSRPSELGPQEARRSCEEKGNGAGRIQQVQQNNEHRYGHQRSQ